MFKSKTLLFTLLLVSIFSFTACSQKAQPSLNTYGGIFETLDNGDTWASKSKIATVQAKEINFHSLDVMNFVSDPEDANTLYAATSMGLFYSYNFGLSWHQSVGMTTGKINDVAVDPKNSCTIYISSGRYLYKSEDCARHFEDIYYEDSPNVEVGPILIDSYNPNIIYIGTSDGDVLKTTDGKTWQTKVRFKQAVLRLLHAKDTRVIFAAVNKLGVAVSEDGADTWSKEITKAQKDFKSSKYVHDIAYDPESNTLISASDYGLLRTTDNGKTWEAIPILTAEGAVHVWAVEIANAGKTIYYATSNNLNYSNDKGKTWLTKSLPTVSRTTNILLKYIVNENLANTADLDYTKVIPDVLLSFRALPKK